MIPDGSLTGALDFEMARKNIIPGVLKGRVAASSGNPVSTPVIVVKKNGLTYLWAQGKEAAYELRLPEGRYTLYASGKNFGPGREVEVTVKSGEERELDFNDVELPATINLTVAEARWLPFIPATEISPSWSHFNALGLPLGRDLANPNNLTVQEIFADARKNGAQLMMVNHPFNNFGYYKALADGKAPGGYYDAYDLVEINGFYVKEHAAMVMERMYEKWNKGLKVYLGGGTDYHDLWAEDYADIRPVAFVESELSPENYLAALKAGHAYISLGPIVYPQFLFGEEAKAGEIGFAVESATPFISARFINNGQVVETRNFDPPTEAANLKFKIPDKGWVSLELDGETSGLLWTNPIWIK